MYIFLSHHYRNYLNMCYIPNIYYCRELIYCFNYQMQENNNISEDNLKCNSQT